MIEENYKKLCTAVIMQACKDYKNKPSEREPIEKWVRDGNIFTSLMLPDAANTDVIVKEQINATTTAKQKKLYFVNFIFKPHFIICY